MRPRLLVRPEIDRRKAEEERQEISEGMKIAEHIDTLREIKSSEEVAFEKWRTDSLAAIQSEIRSKSLEMEMLDSTISSRKREWEAELKKMYGPIDKQWAAYVKGEKERLDEQVKKNEQKEVELNLAIAANIQRERMNEEHAKELDTEKRTYNGLTKQIKEELARAKEVVAEAKRKSSQLLKQADEREKAVKEKEAQIALYEENLNIERKKLEREKVELDQREFKVLAKELQFYSPIKKL